MPFGLAERLLEQRAEDRRPDCRPVLTAREPESDELLRGQIEWRYCREQAAVEVRRAFEAPARCCPGAFISRKRPNTMS